MATHPAVGHDIELDGWLDTRQVEKLTSYTRRWLSELIKAGKFPPPEVAGGLGASHRWRRSTIERALENMASSGRRHTRATREG